ncbi:MAG: CapA family protein [Bacteroidales bacterium]|jgi:poly-gamma-glutamate synthesis protein (capsule biosynthesis protein)|nr:CapA family protein [Bacteroidales bacterium]
MIKKICFWVGVIGLFVSCQHFVNAQQALIEQNNEQDSTLTLLFFGDIMGHAPQYQAAYNSATQSYNYDVCFKYVKKYIDQADIAVANLEVPIAGTPYSGYPQFSSPDELLDALRNAGYDVLLTANNHVMDRGKNGLERTITQILQRRFWYAGSYFNKAQRDTIYPLIIEKKGVKVAILNYTYGTNEIAVRSPNIVNIIDTTQILKDILKADQLGASLKIMTIHWGIEYQLQANAQQRQLAQFLVNHGISAIIGSHPHVVQNAELMCNSSGDGIPVYYSLGNSISNQRKPHTDGGIMVKLVVNLKEKTDIKSSYIPVYVHKGVLDSIYQYHLIPTTDYLIGNMIPTLKRQEDLSALLFFDQETRKRLITNK